VPAHLVLYYIDRDKANIITLLRNLEGGGLRFDSQELALEDAAALVAYGDSGGYI
jgi:hypothetical protein